jgi:hypothetical protein
MSSHSKFDVSTLIAELKALQENTSIDEAQRQELCAALQEASLAVESPLETVNRIGFSVGDLRLITVAECIVDSQSWSRSGGHRSGFVYHFGQESRFNDRRGIGAGNGFSA